jgi:hypothetical protein
MCQKTIVAKNLIMLLITWFFISLVKFGSKLQSICGFLSSSTTLVTPSSNSNVAMNVDLTWSNGVFQGYLQSFDCVESPKSPIEININFL